MGSSQHIGRVGALALALGIGAAAISPMGIARADDSPAEPSSASSDGGSADSTSGASPSAQRETPSGDGSGAEVGADVPNDVPHEEADEVEDETESDAEVEDGSEDEGLIDSGSAEVDDTEPLEPLEPAEPLEPLEPLVPEPPTDVTDTGVPLPPPPSAPDSKRGPDIGDHAEARALANAAAAERTTPTSPAEPSAPEEMATTLALSTAAAADVAENRVAAEIEAIPTPVTSERVRLRPPNLFEMIAAIPQAVFNAVTGVVATMLSPLLIPSLFSTPTTPQETPLLWVVLGWARRRLFNATPGLSPGPATTHPTTGLVTGTLGGFDPDGDAIAYAVLRGPANGTLTIDHEAGTYTYLPKAGYLGEDSFVVSITDSGPDGVFGFLQPGRGHTSAVEISLTSVVAGPAFTVEHVDTGTATSTGAVTGRVNLRGAAVLDTPPTRGSVVLDADGSFVYTPTPLERAHASYGTDDVLDSFTVTVTDPAGQASTLTVTVPVDWSLNAVAYLAPDRGGDPVDLRFINKTFSSVTGRIYRVELAEGSTPGNPLFSLVSVDAHGRVIETAGVRTDAAPEPFTPITANPVTGAGYLMTEYTDPDTGLVTTEVLVITAAGETAHLSVRGSRVGELAFDPDTGVAYQVFEETEDGVPTNRIARFGSDGTPLGVDAVGGLRVDDIVVDPSMGRAYLTTMDFVGAARVTRVTVVSALGVEATHIIDGEPIGTVVIDPDRGVAYQTSRLRAPNRVVVTVLGDDGTTETAVVSIAGVPRGSVVVDPTTGTAYQMFVELGAGNELQSFVAVLRAGQAPTITEVGLSVDRLVVNPNTGTVYVVGSTDTLDPAVTVLRPDGSTSPIALLPGQFSSVEFSPAGDYAVINTTTGLTSPEYQATVVDADGNAVVVPGRVIETPVFAESGMLYITTRGGDTGTLTVFDAQGTMVRTVVLDGLPTGAAVLNPTLGRVYQLTRAADGSDASTLYVVTDGGVDTITLDGLVFPGGLVVNPLDGTVYLVRVHEAPALTFSSTLTVFTADGQRFDHDLPGQPLPADTADPDFIRVGMKLVPNSVLGGGYLRIETGRTPLNFSIEAFVVVSADGSEVSVYDEEEGYVGMTFGPSQVNPVTGLGYQLVFSPNEQNQEVLVYSFHPDGGYFMTDPLDGTDIESMVYIDPTTGTVLVSPNGGVWVVDVDPARAQQDS